MKYRGRRRNVVYEGDRMPIKDVGEEGISQLYSHRLANLDNATEVLSIGTVAPMTIG